MSIGPEDEALVILDGEIRTPPLSHAARLEAGRSLRVRQRHVSLGMPLSRPMPSIGPRRHELRFGDADHNGRIAYRIDEHAIVVAGILDKKTQETPQQFIEQCKDATTSARRRRDRGERSMRPTNTEHVEIERKGGRVTTIKDFLGLSDDEEVEVELAADAFIVAHRQLDEFKTKLVASIRRRRKLVRMGHVLPIDRTRVVKQRRLGPGSAGNASIDRIVSAFIAIGGTRDELTELIARD